MAARQFVKITIGSLRNLPYTPTVICVREKPEGHIRDLPADDPQNPGHASHREQWLEVARAIGRALAEQDYERAKGNDNRSGVRKILNRPTE
jgi:hypothetical protein